MARFKMASPFIGISGQLEGGSSLVYRMRNGSPHGYIRKKRTSESTAAERANQELFGVVSKRVTADMKDPDLKAKWEKVAKDSRGKIKSGRSAAFKYYKKLELER